MIMFIEPELVRETESACGRPRLLDRVRSAIRLHPLHETVFQRAVRDAARQAGLPKRVTCHTFRHSFATHLFKNGHGIRTVQELLGHKSVETTKIDTHIHVLGPAVVISPRDHHRRDQP